MRLIEVKSEIDIICKKLKITNYTVNHETGRVDVNGDVYLKGKRFTNFPIKFGHITGYFNCSNCPSLVSLEGAPTKVDGNFECYSCPKLTSLKYAPTEVGGDFNCADCKNLVSLEGAPIHINRMFSCGNCPNLDSLEHAPKTVGGSFFCNGCYKLTSLKGGPVKVGGGMFESKDGQDRVDHFYATLCSGLNSLEHAPIEVIGDFHCTHIRRLHKLSHLKRVTGKLHFGDTSIDNMLYVFKIKDLKEVDVWIPELKDIINKHLAGDRDLMDCQEEMIEAGFAKYARLK